MFDDAQVALREIISNGSLQARAIVGFYPANAEGDDISLFENDSDEKPR